MRRALIAVMFTAGACGQSLIDPGHVSGALGEFAPRPGDVPLRCELVPVAPTLDFAFRFRAGYTFRLPVAQYQTAGHAWRVLTKIIPQDGKKKKKKKKNKKNQHKQKKQQTTTKHHKKQNKNKQNNQKKTKSNFYILFYIFNFIYFLTFI